MIIEGGACYGSTQQYIIIIIKNSAGRKNKSFTNKQTGFCLNHTISPSSTERPP